MIEKIKKIKMVAFDVDGVLTDSRIIWDSEGRELRCFHVQDGAGIYFLHRLGFQTAVISGKESQAVRSRMEELSLGHIHLGIRRKKEKMDELLEKTSLSLEEVCYMGDDLMDLSLLGAVGFPVAVSNAREEVKAISSYVTSLSGGKGAVREVAELIIKTQKKWKALGEDLGWADCL